MKSNALLKPSERGINYKHTQLYHDDSLHTTSRYYYMHSEICISHIIVCYPVVKELTHFLDRQHRCETSAKDVTMYVVMKKHFFKIF